MLKTYSYLIILSALLGCNRKEPPVIKEPTLPASRVVLNANGESMFDLSYTACDRSPSASETLGTNPSLLLFSPGIFHADDVVNIPDDLIFYFIFHEVDIEYFGDPSLDEFWSYLQENTHEFNKAPYKRDFFLKVKKEGKVYQNWWNGELLGGFGQSISYDETGLEFKNYEFTKFEEFGEICAHDFSVIRLQGDIEGGVITEDRSDTLSINGLLDVFLHVRE